MYILCSGLSCVFIFILNIDLKIKKQKNLLVRGELIICAHHWIVFHFVECGSCCPYDVEFDYQRIANL